MSSRFSGKFVQRAAIIAVLAAAICLQAAAFVCPFHLTVGTLRADASFVTEAGEDDNSPLECCSCFSDDAAVTCNAAPLVPPNAVERLVASVDLCAASLPIAPAYQPPRNA